MICIQQLYCKNCDNNPLAIDQDGMTALMLAAWEGHAALVSYLLELETEVDLGQEVTVCMLAT